MNQQKFYSNIDEMKIELTDDQVEQRRLWDLQDKIKEMKQPRKSMISQQNSGLGLSQLIENTQPQTNSQIQIPLKRQSIFLQQDANSRKSIMLLNNQKNQVLGYNNENPRLSAITESNYDSVNSQIFENNLRTFEDKVNRNIPIIIERQKFYKDPLEEKEKLIQEREKKRSVTPNMNRLNSNSLALNMDLIEQQNQLNKRPSIMNAQIQSHASIEIGKDLTESRPVVSFIDPIKPIQNNQLSIPVKTESQIKKRYSIMPGSMEDTVQTYGIKQVQKNFNQIKQKGVKFQLDEDKTSLNKSVPRASSVINIGVITKKEKINPWQLTLQVDGKKPAVKPFQFKNRREDDQLEYQEYRDITEIIKPKKPDQNDLKFTEQNQEDEINCVKINKIDKEQLEQIYQEPIKKKSSYVNISLKGNNEDLKKPSLKIKHPQFIQEMQNSDAQSQMDQSSQMNTIQHQSQGQNKQQIDQQSVLKINEQSQQNSIKISELTKNEKQNSIKNTSPEITKNEVSQQNSIKNTSSEITRNLMNESQNLEVQDIIKKYEEYDNNNYGQQLQNNQRLSSQNVIIEHDFKINQMKKYEIYTKNSPQQETDLKYLNKYDPDYNSPIKVHNSNNISTDQINQTSGQNNQDIIIKINENQMQNSIASSIHGKLINHMQQDNSIDQKFQMEVSHVDDSKYLSISNPPQIRPYNNSYENKVIQINSFQTESINKSREPFYKKKENSKEYINIKNQEQDDNSSNHSRKKNIFDNDSNLISKSKQSEISDYDLNQEIETQIRLIRQQMTQHDVINANYLDLENLVDKFIHECQHAQGNINTQYLNLNDIDLQISQINHSRSQKILKLTEKILMSFQQKLKNLNIEPQQLFRNSKTQQLPREQEDNTKSKNKFFELCAVVKQQLPPNHSSRKIPIQQIYDSIGHQKDIPENEWHELILKYLEQHK